MPKTKATNTRQRLTPASFTFADLFAGVGGMRLAFEKAGGRCVLTSEIDENAMKTYRLNFPKHSASHQFCADVVALGAMSEAKIADHDVLVAGFPCQPYSIAGLRQGLDDEKGRGSVFYSLVDILKKKKPKAFMLENVKGMLSHDGGRTIDFMIDILSRTGYTVIEPKVLNSMIHGGVPQNRERVFIIGFRNDLGFRSDDFKWPARSRAILDFTKKLEKEVDEKYFYSKEKYDCYSDIKKLVKKTDTVYQWRRVYVRENKSGVCPALTANMGSGGHNVPLIKDGARIRKLTPRECANLQGFPRSFEFPATMADSHLYHQMGNSVTVPLIEKLAREIARHI